MFSPQEVRKRHINNMWRKYYSCLNEYQSALESHIRFAFNHGYRSQLLSDKCTKAFHDMINAYYQYLRSKEISYGE